MISNNNSSLLGAGSGCHLSTLHASCYMLPVSVIIAIFVLILLVDLIGNAIVVLVIISKRRMRTFTNFLILNLAFADLSVALFCIPLEIPIELDNKWLYGRFFCTVFYPLQSSTIYGSVFTLVVLSCSRYWALIHPFKKQPNKLAAKVLIVLIWMTSVSLVVPYMLGLQLDTDGQHCKEVWTPAEGRRYTIVTFSLQYILPLTIIILAYSVIIYDIVFKKNPSAKHADKIKDKENKKLIKLLLIVTSTFALSVLPYHVVALLVEFGNAGKFKYIQDVSLAAYITLYLNSAINPIIYNIFSSNFRRGFSESYKRTSNYFFKRNLMEMTRRKSQQQKTRFISRFFRKSTEGPYIETLVVSLQEIN